ncbi:dimethylarginine dimethylaminohydrolase family protein [Halomonas saccharevitans]|uniref:arginine deiminase n=1 Tax=Halomonas saccharevitans TaxID=416872 RepID=A0A1I7CGK4_9GAMM|nr:arginine deiminase family protein [Halomonas saccharevitans]SFT98568.1 N-Dimethylarginine dimethylaminohydrolase [Halomonas saccharevitans]
MSHFGCHSMAAPMTRVLMRRPGASLRAADPAEWHYNDHFDADKAITQYDTFAELVKASGAEIVWIEDEGDGLSDAMFTRDASLITRAGAVLLKMGKPLRAAEPELHGRHYEAAGIPVLGRLTGEACVEGGDTLWLDDSTLVVGMGFRSNREGVGQLNALLNPHGIEVLGFDLPVWDGEAACLHLMSVISPLTDELYLVHPKLIPAALWTLMKSRGITLVAAPEAEFHDSLGLNLNVMPLSPGDCLMIDGFPATKAVMEQHGIRVRTFAGDALCMACEGGPTCLTNPILREA